MQDLAMTLNDIEESYRGAGFFLVFQFWILDSALSGHETSSLAADSVIRVSFKW